MKSKIVVVGSSNTDMVVKSPHLPLPGETVLGNTFIMSQGGKGANQAVAASRLGGDVLLIAKIGTDVFGQEAERGFKLHGINTRFVIRDETSHTGVALIMVDEKGENSISVAPGANANLGKLDLDKARPAFRDTKFLVVQLEIPIDTVEEAVRICKEENVKVVLNPAPARSLNKELLQSLYIITPNQSEAEVLTGVKVDSEDSARKAAWELIKIGVEIVIITMGKKGAYVLSEKLDQWVPGFKVNAVDTTAAGDTFNGALVVGLSEGMPVLDAVAFANKAAAYSVTKMGAQLSTPLRKDLIHIT